MVLEEKLYHLINENAFELLDAPVKELHQKMSQLHIHLYLEDQILVQTDWIVDAINEISRILIIMEKLWL